MIGMTQKKHLIETLITTHYGTGGMFMNIVQATTTCLKKYFIFSGRAKRSEYWWFYLFATLVGIAYGSIVNDDFYAWILDQPLEQALEGLDLTSSIIIVILTYLPWLVFITPTLAAGSRRLHDIGKSGWWQLLVLTIIGGVLLIVWFATGTKEEGDKYGEALAETA